MKFLLLLTLFALPSLAQEVKTSYDKFKDVTTVTYKDRIQFNHFYVLATFKGQERTDGTYWIIFTSPYTVRDHYDRRASLVFLADGERVTFNVPRYDLERNTQGLEERLYYTTNKDDLAKIANAKEVEFQLGRIVAKLSDKQKKGILEVLEK